MYQLKHEHQRNLIFCENIRTGFTRGVPLQRIKLYADWYWQNYLARHFQSEEELVFSILGMNSKLVKKAMAEHGRLKRLFESPGELYKTLNRIEEELEAHVRFEDWILFQQLPRNFKYTKIETKSFAENASWTDEFWKESTHNRWVKP